MRNVSRTERQLNTKRLTARRRKRLLARFSLVMVCIVIFGTSYGMILPALTAEKADMTGTSLMVEEDIEESAETVMGEDSGQESFIEEESLAVPEAGTLVEILEEGSGEARLGIVLETETNEGNEEMILVLENTEENGLQVTELSADDPSVTVLDETITEEDPAVAEEIREMIEEAKQEDLLAPEVMEQIETELPDEAQAPVEEADRPVTEVEAPAETAAAYPAEEQEAEAAAPVTAEETTPVEVTVPAEEAEVAAGEAGPALTMVSDMAEEVLDSIRMTVSLEGSLEGILVKAEFAEGVLPADVQMKLSSVEDETYSALVEDAAGKDRTIRKAMDITFLSGGSEVEPEGEVKITFKADFISDLTQPEVVHFPGDGTAEVMDAKVKQDALVLKSSSFSVYAIVDAPEPAQVEIRTVADVNELANNTSEAFYLSVPTNRYFQNTLNNNNALTITTNVRQAAPWYFEPAGAANTYYIYTYIDKEKKYINNYNGNLLDLRDAGTPLEVSPASNGQLYIKVQGEDKWLQYSGGGKGIRFWPENTNAGNVPVTLTYVSSFSLPKDPYGLDGKTYGIAYHNNTATAGALMGEVKDAQHLKAEKLLIQPDVINNSGILLMAKDSDITDWTFESVKEDKYYITTTVDGAKKYLNLNGRTLTLVDEPGEKSLFTATPGTDANSGKYSFSVNNYAIDLNLSGTDVSKGFWGNNGNTSTRWLNLVERSVLNDDDFNLYRAKKVSVSDEEYVYDKEVDGERVQSQVIIYTRIWNDEEKNYDIYAVDHDGSLVYCYDTGDGIEWVGSKVNTALWEFTEYHNADGTPNYYYELQNVQYKDYIAPQMTGGQILSENTLGINMSGRRYGENYTTIVAWDDDNYMYVGLKVEDGRIVSCPLSEAEDFFFAVVTPPVPEEEEEDVTEIRTVDSEQYGITMKMVDFNDVNSHNRDKNQEKFFHDDNDHPGLLSTDLKENGYPDSTEVTQRPGHSLNELFTGMTPVNHLFLKSIYNESGYFEYDSTQNFAHLNEDGTFTVYDQLGAITGSGETRVTRTHGQFMPYDDIQDGVYAIDSAGNYITNQTNVLGQELPDTNPRKGEKLYDLGKNTEVDYFFGMEMEAGFTQTANGLDAWGHDIIFEFSGDDDFWFYVDGELVLDLGGVHSAMTGSINFRTGEVKSGRGNSTLYDIFRSNYEERGLSEAEIAQKLEEIFEEKQVNGSTVRVFKDYTNHDMKMFYMERGAGASNLHMRFNLAAVKPGSFILSKKLSGTENENNDLVEFPYQICYYTLEDGHSVLHYLGEEEGDTDRVVYAGGTAKVRYQESFTPAGGTRSYNHVFFLKPGQSAEVNMPDNTRSYYVVECGVNPDVYDRVSANNLALEGAETENLVGGTPRRDHRTIEDTLRNRNKVEFDNHVKEGAMRTLSLTKKLYDSDGTTLLHYPENSSVFSFRLYLGDENADPDNLPPANMYQYHVKDPQGNYCRWDAAGKRFVSLGKTDYSQLTQAEKDRATFDTSMNGSISKIPADYTVEVRDLIIGSQYKVEERDREVPKGYTRRDADGYVRTDVEPAVAQSTPYSGTMMVGEDPAIEIRNQKGWGLTAKKVWTDGDFMAAHDSIYFAIYLNGVLLDDTVRELPTSETEVYYFFQDLFDQQGNNHFFNEYEVREVTISDASPTIVDGVVTDPGTVTPIGEGGNLTINGTAAGGTVSGSYTYNVHYDKGESTGKNENVRTDTITNSRPGIELIKTDWAGSPLSGAAFTLTDENGASIAARSYTSGQDGKITIAYLPEGTFLLTETSAPKGFVVLDEPMRITVASDGSITGITGVDETLYEITTDNPQMAATVTIKNRSNDFTVKKVDASTGEALEGVHFALYRQVEDTDGNKRKDYYPINGYEDLETDENGVLESISMGLNPGTYYLTETRAAENYRLLAEDLCFTIGSDGTVSINSGGDASWLNREESAGGQVAYLLSIPNSTLGVPIRVVKVDQTGAALEGAGFVFEGDSSFGDAEGEMISAKAEGSEEAVVITDDAVPLGTYTMHEQTVPAGYNEPEGDVQIAVESGSGNDVVVRATINGEETAFARAERAAGQNVWVVTIMNTTGYELPSTGGSGTKWLYRLGALLIFLAGAGLTVRLLRRRLA